MDDYETIDYKKHYEATKKNEEDIAKLKAEIKDLRVKVAHLFNYGNEI